MSVLKLPFSLGIPVTKGTSLSLDACCGVGRKQKRANVPPALSKISEDTILDEDFPQRPSLPMPGHVPRSALAFDSNNRVEWETHAPVVAGLSTKRSVREGRTRSMSRSRSRSQSASARASRTSQTSQRTEDVLNNVSNAVKNVLQWGLRKEVRSPLPSNCTGLCRCRGGHCAR